MLKERRGLWCVGRHAIVLCRRLETWGQVTRNLAKIIKIITYNNELIKYNGVNTVIFNLSYSAFHAAFTRSSLAITCPDPQPICIQPTSNHLSPPPAPVPSEPTPEPTRPASPPNITSIATVFARSHARRHARRHGSNDNDSDGGIPSRLDSTSVPPFIERREPEDAPKSPKEWKGGSNLRLT